MARGARRAAYCVTAPRTHQMLFTVEFVIESASGPTPDVLWPSVATQDEPGVDVSGVDDQ